MAYATEHIKGHLLLAKAYREKGDKEMAIKEAKLAIHTRPDYSNEPEADLWKEEAKELLNELKGK